MRGPGTFTTHAVRRTDRKRQGSARQLTIARKTQFILKYNPTK